MKSNYFKSLITWSRVLLLAVLCLPLTAMATSTFGGGDGTENNPYQIKTEADLRQLATDVNTGTNYAGTYFKLMNDITLTAEWTPIGMNSGNNSIFFSGHFDGDAHSIRELYMKETDKSTTYGLFGFVQNSSISNLHIHLAKAGIQIACTKDEWYYIGTFIGVMTENSKLNNCYLTTDEQDGGIISAKGEATSMIGTLVGSVSGSLENCYSTVSVEIGNENAYVGGISGMNSGLISNCYATGAIKSLAGESSAVGGIAGMMLATTSNCLALNKKIEFAGTNIGRIVGLSYGILSGNYASTLTAGTWTKKGADKEDGTDTKATRYLTDITWDPAIWTTSEDNLPTLKSFSNQPVLPTADYMQKPNWTDFAEQAIVSTIEPTADVYVDGNTYTINTEKGLAWLAGVVNSTFTTGDNIPSDVQFQGKTVKLGADLDLGKDAYKDLSWEPIGGYGLYPVDFRGDFDGQGHSIKGLWIEIESDSYELHVGLFGRKEDSKLSNLHIQLSTKGIKVKHIAEHKDGKEHAYVGAFIGSQDSEGLLENCYLTAEEGGKIAAESTTSLTVGGLAGETVAIRSCYSTVPVSVTSDYLFAGGICGIVYDTLSNCYVTGMVDISAPNQYVYAGGICAAGEVISDNLALNQVKKNNEGNMGRIMSYIEEGGVFSNNYASTLIEGVWKNKGADKPDGADIDAFSFWNNLNGTDNKWAAYVKDPNNVNLPKLAGEWSQPQPDLTIANYLSVPSHVTLVQPEVGGLLIVKDHEGKTIESDTFIAKNNILTLECLPQDGYQLKAYKANGTKVEANADGIYTYTITDDVLFSVEFEEVEPTPPPYYTVTLPDVDGATLSIEPGNYSLVEGSSFSFSLELKDGYKNSVPVVKANGVVVKLSESDGKYVVYSIYSDTEITIEGIVKDTPTGIDSADNTVRVRTVASTLYIYTPAEETVCIFALTGTLCREPLKVWGDAQVQLPAGVYIVRIADKSYKAVIR